MGFVADKSRFIPDTPTATLGEEVAGSFGGRVLASAANTVIGAPLQLGANLGDKIAEQFGFTPVVGKAINEHLANLKAMQEKGMAAAGNSGFDWGGLVGSGVIGGAALKNIPAAATYLGKVLQGAGFGTILGAATPVTDNPENFFKEKAIQTGIGTVAGGALSALVPPATAIGKWGYTNLVEPWLNPTAIKGRAYLSSLANKANDVVPLLRQNEQIVPGSMPNAGEAAAPAGSTGFSALQKGASRVPQTADLYQAGTDAANAARVAQLRTVGQTPEALQTAETARTAAANPLYQAAREGTAPVDIAPILDKVNGILDKNPGNRELVTELNNIKKGLEAAGSDAQKVSSVLDGLKTSISNKDNSFIRGQLSNIKEQISVAIPGYANAQAVFKKASEPINQMQIGQYLENKLVPALSDEAKQKSAAYAAALENAPGTIKNALGTPRYETLTKALTTEQLAAVNSVRDDLARTARYDQLAKTGGADVQNIASTSQQEPLGGPIPAFLKRSLMVFHSIIDRLGGKIDKKIAAEIATEMTNPPGVADSIAQEQMRQAKNKVIAKAIQQMRAPETVGTQTAVKLAPSYAAQQGQP